MGAERTLTARRTRDLLSDVLQRISGEKLQVFTVEQWFDHFVKQKQKSRADKTALRHEQMMKEFVQFLGHRAHLNIAAISSKVNEGEFRIDLAIVHPTENRHALGVECYGAAFHSSWSARCHDIWQQRVLESCGWKIYRIWSTEWWRNHSTQLDALLHAAQHACR
jgi:very-short-patch-repair endonuclease